MKRNKEGFINLNGICIWHPNPFVIRRRHMLFYDYRARKIIFCACNTHKSILKALIRDIGSCVVTILTFGYDDLWYQYMALKNFYDGIDLYVKRNPEYVNQKLMGMKQYKKCSLDVTSINFEKIQNYGRYEALLRLIINIFIPATKEKYYPIDIPESWRCVDYIGAKKIYFIDKITGDGVCIERNNHKMIKSIKIIFKMFVLISLNHRKKYDEWSKRMDEIRNYDFWKKYLSLD